MLDAHDNLKKKKIWNVLYIFIDTHDDLVFSCSIHAAYFRPCWIVTLVQGTARDTWDNLHMICIITKNGHERIAQLQHRRQPSPIWATLNTQTHTCHVMALVFRHDQQNTSILKRQISELCWCYVLLFFPTTSYSHVLQYFHAFHGLNE